MTPEAKAAIAKYLVVLSQKTVDGIGPESPAHAPIAAARDSIVAGLSNPLWQEAVTDREAVVLVDNVDHALNEFVLALLALYDFEFILAESRGRSDTVH